MNEFYSLLCIFSLLSLSLVYASSPSHRRIETQLRVDALQLDKDNPKLWNLSAYAKIMQVIKNLKNDGPLHDKIFRPDVSITFKFTELYQLDEANRVMLSRVRMRKTWVDPRIATIWPSNALLDGLPEKAGKIYVDRREIYVPNIPIRNVIRPIEDLGFSGYDPEWIKIRPGGIMQEDYHTFFAQTSCETEVALYPYDTIFCDLVLNGIGAVELGPGSIIVASIDTKTFFVKNSEWSVLDVSSKIEEENGIITIKLRRQVKDTFFYLVLPGVIITSVSFLQFLLPAESGERTGIGVTCLLSMVVFMTMLDQKFSPDRLTIPRLASFFGISTGIITFTIASSTFVIMINGWTHERYNSPGCSTYKFICFLGKLACYKDKFLQANVVEVGSMQENPNKLPRISPKVRFEQMIWISFGAILDRMFVIIFVFGYIVVGLIYLTPPADYYL